MTKMLCYEKKGNVKIRFPHRRSSCSSATVPISAFVSSPLGCSSESARRSPFSLSAGSNRRSWKGRNGESGRGRRWKTRRIQLGSISYNLARSEGCGTRSSCRLLRILPPSSTRSNGPTGLGTPVSQPPPRPHLPRPMSSPPSPLWRRTLLSSSWAGGGPLPCCRYLPPAWTCRTPSPLAARGDAQR